MSLSPTKVNLVGLFRVVHGIVRGVVHGVVRRVVCREGVSG